MRSNFNDYLEREYILVGWKLGTPYVCMDEDIVSTSERSFNPWNRIIVYRDIEQFIRERIRSNEPYGRYLNVCVQGFTALALTSGFYQCHRAAIESNGYFKLRPLTVVHDSCTNEFNTERLFEIGQFYYKNMTQFLYDRFGIRYKFGTFIGDNYFDVSELDPIEEGKKIGLTGSATSLNKILGKLDEINYPYRFLVGDKDMLVPSKPKSIFDAFYGRWGECVYDRDYSSYHIELESLA